MKKFRFPLAALLSLRKQQTQKCEFLLAAELGKLSMIKSQIENIRINRDKAFSIARAELDDLRMREALLRKALNEHKVSEMKLKEARKKVEEARLAYQRVRTKSSALEKLEEKRRHYWKLQVRKEEIKNLDEIAKGGYVAKPDREEE